MKRSGDLMIGRSGDRKNKFTAETRRRGENQKLTTEARRHGEVEDRDKRSGPDCVRPTKQVSGPDFSRAEKEKNEWASAPEFFGRVPDSCKTCEESRRTDRSPDHPITRDHQITRSPLAPAVFRSIAQIVRATLREIFDESAYDRFLLRTKLPRSVTSYRDFARERDAALLKKPRCC
jgi:hypothetical protein